MRQLIDHAATDYAIFMVTVLCGLLGLALFLYFRPEQKSGFSFPGLNPSDPISGNLQDITKAGSFHQFLMAMHKTHGPIVGFWWGKQHAVSVASPVLWKDVLPLFNRPVNQFLMFERLIGKHSIQYANFAEGKKHRGLIDRCFGHSEMLSFSQCFNKVAKDLCHDWSQCARGKEHIPLRQQMLGCMLKSILQTSFGEALTGKEMVQFEKAYDTCWGEMEMQLNGSILTDDTPRKTQFDQALLFLREIPRKVLNRRRNSDDRDQLLLIDHMIANDSIYPDDEAIIDNIITNIIGGFHTTGNLLTWLLFYLAENPVCEVGLCKEIQANCLREDVTMEEIAAMPYLRSIIDETMRCSTLAPWAARFSEYDSVVGGHTITKETPIILALGTVLQDEEIWEQPERFDPLRFSAPSAKTSKRHPLAFSPFGFAGKRKCPGYRFAYVEASIMAIQLLRRFHIKLIPGQKVEKVYGLVTQPKEEVWVSVEERQNPV